MFSGGNSLICASKMWLFSVSLLPYDIKLNIFEDVVLGFDNLFPPFYRQTSHRLVKITTDRFINSEKSLFCSSETKCHEGTGCPLTLCRTWEVKLVATRLNADSVCDVFWLRLRFLGSSLSVSKDIAWMKQKKKKAASVHESGGFAHCAKINYSLGLSNISVRAAFLIERWKGSCERLKVKPLWIIFALTCVWM